MRRKSSINVSQLSKEQKVYKIALIKVNSRKLIFITYYHESLKTWWQDGNKTLQHQLKLYQYHWKVMGMGWVGWFNNILIFVGFSQKTQWWSNSVIMSNQTNLTNHYHHAKKPGYDKHFYVEQELDQSWFPMKQPNNTMSDFIKQVNVVPIKLVLTNWC